MKAELLFTGFICDYDLLISTADHAGKLLKVMFPDSKIAKKYSCGRKRQQMFYLELSLKSQLASNPKSTLSSSDQYKWFGFATDGSSDENDKFLSMLIRHFASNGLVTTSLLDMPDINTGSDSHVMFQTCNSSLMRASLSWEIGCTYSSDNNSSMIGKNKSLLNLIKDAQSELPQKIFDVGCPCHLAHLCAQKGAKALSMQVDDFVTDLFYHFKRSVKRKATLRGHMEFTNTGVKKIIKHVTTRWLSLGKSPDKTHAMGCLRVILSIRIRG